MGDYQVLFSLFALKKAAGIHSKNRIKILWRGLDILVAKVVKANLPHTVFLEDWRPHHLAAGKAVECGKYHARLNGITFRYPKEPSQFLIMIDVPSKPNFRNGISPYIWDDCGKAEWSA